MKINSYEKLLAMLLLQAANLPKYQAEVGATNADIQAVTEQAATLQYIVEYLGVVDADKKTVTKIKQTAYNGETDESPTPFPTFPIAAPPFPVVAGCSELCAKRNRRFKAADGYTKDIGVALGIDGDSATDLPELIVPTLEIHPAQMNYEAAIVVGNRGKSDMWQLLGRKMNSEKWTELKSGTGKGSNVKITPTVAGNPEQVEMKIQLIKANEPYGQLSNGMLATFNP